MTDAAGGGDGNGSTVARTVAALGVAVSRRDSRWVLLLATVGYLLVYLVTVGDLGPAGPGAPSVRFAGDASRALATTGFFRFDAVAVASAWGVTYLFSPGRTSR